MDLQSPSTLFAAWVLVPAVMVLAAAGIGGGVARMTGVRFGALTLPVGFLGGIVLMTGLLKLGASGTVTVVLAAIAAVAGAASAVWPAYRRSEGIRDLAVRTITSRDTLAPALAASAAYALALAPLVGSGRAGVLGYILNNDPSVHSTLVELLAQNGAHVGDDGFTSSYDTVGELFSSGYPLGSHVWPLFGRVATGIDTFYIWSPAIAIAAAMLALIAYASLRRLAAPRLFATPAAALVPCGYLFYSFLIQGSAKEAVTAVAVYGSVVIAGHIVLDHLTWRAAPALAIGPAAALFTFGAGAASWVAPAFVAFLGIVLWRMRTVRPPRAVLIAAGVATLAIAALAVPVVREALDYVRSAEGTLRNPAQVGNLLGAVPWEQSLNFWYAYDFRVKPPVLVTLSDIGPWVAGVFAVLGLLYAAIRRDVVIPLLVIAGVVAAIVISERYSIYLDTKAYAILGPAIGVATAAGVAALLAGPLAVRILGIVSGVVLASGILVGASLVYAGAWVTPEQRFEEVDAIANRFAGDGPILVNEREEWDYYLLRDLDPVVSWGVWFERRGFRIGEKFPPFLPHTPDFDDFESDFMGEFRLLLERKGPGGSRAPSNFKPVYETTHYRVWERDEPAPKRHLALGRFTLDNTARLDCGDGHVRNFFRAARRSGRDVVASVPRVHTILAADANVWTGHELRSEVPPPGMINRRGGAGGVRPHLAPGTYDAWIQGSFGPGIQLYVEEQPYGTVFGDLGLPSAWHSLGQIQTDGGRVDMGMTALAKPWWQSGSQRSDLTGQLTLEPVHSDPRLRRVAPRALDTLCGQRLDWLDLPS